jgi:hypothetical protein
MKKRLPLGRWTKRTPENNSSEEKHPVAPAPVTASDEKSRQHEAARLEALINSIDQIVLELDAEGTFLNIWANDEKLLFALGANCWGEGPRTFSTRIFSAPRMSFSSG